MDILQNILQLIVGVVFVLGGAYIARCALDAKNMIEAALFGMLGVSVGLFLIICVICGAPGGVGRLY
ncbi:MAG: hypothetical protein K2X27_22170 [Candidatus Obscuribacterales bacterium]|nr:hypothetical protein [Candidatus Obscuribacterales bacterium]